MGTTTDSDFKNVRQPERSRSCPDLMIKWLSNEAEFEKYQENYKKIDCVSLGGFLKSCLACEKDMDGKNVYMLGNFEAFCSQDCRFRYQYIRARQWIEKSLEELEVSEAFKNYNPTKIRRLGH